MNHIIRKFLPGAFALLLCTGCDSYDDSSLWGKVNEIDDRVTNLENLCNRLNTEITSIHTILDAIQANDQIKSVIPIHDLAGKEIGYEIEFVKAGKIIIYHGQDGQDGKDGVNGQDGKDGADGQTPIVSVATDTDGLRYWTVNGQWLLDGNGNKIKAEGRDGKDGLNGKDGADGKDGVDGKDGTNGKDGKNGKDGVDGKDGADGAVGKDGQTPNLTAEKDSDGIIYWKINGQWLLDSEGNRVKALGMNGADGTNGKDGVDGKDGQNGADGENGKDGVDGKDGVTPQLKIENGNWFVSVDKGETWEDLGPATGANGSDGDSMFESVTHDDSYVYFTLADGTLLTVEKATATEQISIVFNDKPGVNTITRKARTDGSAQAFTATYKVVGITDTDNVIVTCSYASGSWLESISYGGTTGYVNYTDAKTGIGTHKVVFTVAVNNIPRYTEVLTIKITSA